MSPDFEIAKLKEDLARLTTERDLAIADAEFNASTALALVEKATKKRDALLEIRETARAIGQPGIVAMCTLALEEP